LRETETLSPENFVGKAHAITLAGGSVFGLAAADGVVIALSQQGIGLRLKPQSSAIPIVPGAVLHDLDGDGDEDWGTEPPYRRLGQESVLAAGRSFELGSVGAGRGAKAGTLKGGLGSASLDLGEGIMVGALVAANPMGSVFMPDGRTYWAWPFEIGEEFGGVRPAPDSAPAIDPVPDFTRLNSLGRTQIGANTTLAIVAASVDLTTAECKRLAMMAQDGLARAIRPVHTPFDGDTVFAAAKGVALATTASDRAAQISRIGSAAADCLARAIARAVYHARAR